MWRRYYRSEIDPREVVREVRAPGGDWEVEARFWPVPADPAAPGVPPELVGVTIEEF